MTTPRPAAATIDDDENDATVFLVLFMVLMAPVILALCAVGVLACTIAATIRAVRWFWREWA